jgi:signal peptidase I
MTTLIPLIALMLIIVYRKKLADEWHQCRTQTRVWLHQKWKNWGEPFIVAAILALVIRGFLIGPYKIPTGSMIPTLMVGDRIFVDKLSYRFRDPVRGDIIVFKYPLDQKKEFHFQLGSKDVKFYWDNRKDFVKRLAGMPGDKLEIREGKLFVNGKAMDSPPFSDHYYYNRPDWAFGKEGQIIEVPPNSYFALGDNSAQSSDSRFWGFVPKQNLVGKAFFIWWPPKRVKLAN